MIKNFENVKKQLGELAGVINSFKSEAVQLRIIELILGQPQEKENGGPQEKTKISSRKRAHSKKETKTSQDGEGTAKRKQATAGKGAVATLGQLASKDFFKTPRTIRDIIEYCSSNLARRFKANEFSGALARMVRNAELSRKKNKDNQYEYKRP